MFRRKFEKCKTHENWIRYKTQRNQVSNLRRKSFILNLDVTSQLKKMEKSFGQLLSH